MKIHHTSCPVCGREPVEPLFTAKDHSVSGETFSIWHCRHCTVRFTQDAPDEQHIGKYYAHEQYISHSDTSKGFVNQLYHKARKLTLKQKRKRVEQETKMLGGRLLDVGAGTGAFVAEMKKSGWDVNGIETDAGARENARSLHGVELLSGDSIYTLQNSYDAITLWHVLEHVHDLHGYGEAFNRLLKPSGVLMIAVPNYQSADAKFYGPAWAAWDVPRHLYHFSPKSMEEFLNRHGFSVYRKIPMWFDSFYVSLLSEPYATGKGNIPRAFLKGLSSNFSAIGKSGRCSSVIYLARKD